MDHSINLLIKIFSKYENLTGSIMSINFDSNKISFIKKLFKVDIENSDLKNVQYYDYILISIVDMGISFDELIKLVNSYKKNFIIEVPTDFAFYKFVKKGKISQIDIYDTRNVNLGYYYITINKN